jgi:hypothetical protein
MNSTELLDAVGLTQNRFADDAPDFVLDRDLFVEDLMYSGLIAGAESELTLEAPQAPDDLLSASLERCLTHSALHGFTVVDAFEILYTAWESAQGKDLKVRCLRILHVSRTISVFIHMLNSSLSIYISPC